MRIFIGKKLIYVLIVWLSISSASIFVLLSKAPGSVCAFWRLFLSSMIILPLWIRSSRRYSYLTVPSGLFLAFHFILWMESLYMIPVMISTILVVTYPFYNLFIDRLFFEEKIDRKQVLGLILGFAGIAGFYSPRISGDLNLLGVTYASLAGFLAAVYFSIGRYLRGYKDLETFEYVFPTYTFASIFVLLYNIYHRIDLINYSPTTYLFFLLLAIVPMMGGHTLMNYLLGSMKTVTITSIAIAEPVGAGLLAFLILGQTIRPLQAVFSVLVLFSLYIVVRYGEHGAH